MSLGTKQLLTATYPAPHCILPKLMFTDKLSEGEETTTEAGCDHFHTLIQNPGAVISGVSSGLWGLVVVITKGSPGNGVGDLCVGQAQSQEA